MTELAKALKDEIKRLARKEIKQQTSGTQQSVVKYRREIAQLKRQLREQAKRIAFLEARERERLESPASSVEEREDIRFSPRYVQAQRKRTGLSAADFARLVGVSALTIYNWEHGKSRPRKAQLAALAALRGMGKRDAEAKLKLLGEKPGSARRKK